MSETTRRKVKATTRKQPWQEKERMLVVCFLLAAVVLIAFWQVARCDFINLDDPSYVTKNGHIQHGVTMEGMRWAFRIGYDRDWHYLTWMYWHPLTWMSHMLDVQLFGMNPRWHHLTNLLLHIANTLALFLVLYRMTKARWQSAFVAALFALHPLHVESVAWVAERKDVLSTFFWILSMGAYARYVERRRLQEYLTLLVCFALGLMAKPMLVTLPFALLLLDYWPLRRFEAKRPDRATSVEVNKRAEAEKRRGKSGRRQKASAPEETEGPADYRYQLRLIGPLLREKIPLFAMAALSSVITYMVQQKGGAVESLEGLPLRARLANAFVSYCVYMGKMLWPDNLAILYPHPGSWPLWQTVPAVLLFAAITAAVIRAALKFPYLLSGWLWYVGTLVPVIGIVQSGMQARADRFTYIPLIGLFIIAAWGIPDLLKKWRYRNQALIASSAVVLSCFFVATWVQVGYWQNSITLYNHSLAVTPPSGLILNNRGTAYSNLGDYARAIRDFDSALKISPGYPDAYYNRGVAYNALGDYTRAIGDFDRTIKIDPEYTDAYINRGVAYGTLGDYTRAISDFDRALRINPEYAKTYYNRGTAYGMAGDYTRAISDFDRAVSIDPEYADVYDSRGAAYGTLGDYTRAISDFDRALRINPEYAIAYYNRAMAYNIVGNHARAFADLEQAARFGNEAARALLKSQGKNR